MRARLPGIRLGCRRVYRFANDASCDSWNVILLGNMVFLVLVSVNVELGGGIICEFFCFIPRNNGGIGDGG